MKFWDFSDFTFLAFFIVVCIGIIMLIVFVVSYILSTRKDNIDKAKIKSDAFTTRVYKIDVKSNKVIYFNKNNIRDKRVITLDGFYERFSTDDVAKVKQWIFNICLNAKTVDQYLDVDVTLNKGKSTYFSLLKLVKYDTVEGIIHVESFILRYLSSSQDDSSRFKSSKSLPIGIVKRSVIEELFNNSKSTRGFTFAIRFFTKRQIQLSNEKIERYMMMTLKNVIFPFVRDAKNPRQLLDDGNNEVVLFDLRIRNTDEAMRLANSISHDLNRCIGVNGFDASVSYSISVLENSLHYQDFETALLKAQETCMAGQHSGETIVLYQKSATANDELTKYQAEINSILKPGALRYLFRPIVDSHRHKIIGYFEYVKAYDTPFATYEEMSKYAARFDKNKELFATVAKYVIPKFSSESENKSWRLFFKISFLDLDYVIPVLESIPETKNVKIVLMLDEQEINENSSNLEQLNNQLRGISESSNVELAMVMKDKNLLLDSSVYEDFDYFVAGSMMISEIKLNSRTRLSIHSLIEQLLKYKRPIIATDLESWQSVELIIKSGISIISTEAVSPSNDMLLPIEKKKMDKLVEMDESYN